MFAQVRLASAIACTVVGVVLFGWLMSRPIIDYRSADALGTLQVIRTELRTRVEHGHALPHTLDEAGLHAVDPWGNPYIFKVFTDGQSFRVYSAGKNGVDEEGRSDDLEEFSTADARFYPEFRRPVLPRLSLALLLAGGIWLAGEVTARHHLTRRSIGPRA